MIPGIKAIRLPPMLPPILTYHWHRRQRFAIRIANILVGWAGIGWAVALVWACVRAARSSPIDCGSAAHLARSRIALPQLKSEPAVPDNPHVYVFQQLPLRLPGQAAMRIGSFVVRRR